MEPIHDEPSTNTSQPPASVNSSSNKPDSKATASDGSKPATGDLTVSEPEAPPSSAANSSTPVESQPVSAAPSKPITFATTPAGGLKPIPNKLADPNLQQIPTEELLGSVTTFYPSGDAECGHALRTSARVIHKMRMDSIRGSTPPPPDKKDGGSGSTTGKVGAAGGTGCQSKTPNQQRQPRMVWSNQDKNLFFEALNECGKDFEGIANYLNTKKRRKDSNSEHAIKVKDVRHLYYQFNQKVLKYLHFSDEVKKEAQELYGLINYGEMRKKVPFQNKKYFHKLKDLVYKGLTTVREKGRNIRIKTPSCRALRKLNQLEEWQEEIRLPPRVDVILKPATIGAWGRVQSLAQNPRVKTTVTLQKRLSTLLQLLQQKWRHQDVRLVDRIASLKTASSALTSKVSRQKALHELELCARMTGDGSDGESQKLLCFTPSKDVVIHRPMINLTEFLSSYSICLNSYEQRIGAKVRGEALCTEKLSNFKDRMGSSSKRQRHDSGCEKHSPDGKKIKAELKEVKEEKVGGDAVGVVNFSEGFKSPNASNESIDLPKDAESSDGECVQAAVKPILGDVLSDGPDLKSPESNDSAKLPGLSKLKLDLDSGISSTTGDNSNDGATSESEQAKPVKIEEASELANTEDLIKTTVKRKESKEKCGKRKDSKTGTTGLSSFHFRPLISEEAAQKIREGWTVQNVGDLTVGDLYIMFGEENKLQLEYVWVMPKEEKSEVAGLAPVEGTAVLETGDELGEESKEQLTTNGGIVPQKTGDISKSVVNFEINLSGRLKQLLQIANLNEKTGKRRCPCGHVCDRRSKIVAEPTTSASTLSDNLLFKQPLLPTRSGNSATTLANCNLTPSPTMRYKQSRWWRMRVHQQLPVARVMLPNGALPHPPARNNNNNINSAGSSKGGGPPPATTNGPTASASSSHNHSQTPQLATNGNGSAKATASSNKVQPVNDDHLTKALEEKMNKFENGNKPKRVPAAIADGLAADDSSCLSLFDISLPSTSSTLIADLMKGTDITDGSLADAESSNCTTISATRILRESPVDGKLLETDINDISLSSFLGHLDAVYDNEVAHRRRDNDQMNISIISESSVDYIARFEDIAAELRAQQE